ncbi:hypothetical protein JCM11641_005499 [Rhodosporidiobolus odoratus]
MSKEASSLSPLATAFSPSLTLKNDSSTPSESHTTFTSTPPTPTSTSTSDLTSAPASSSGNERGAAFEAALAIASYLRERHEDDLQRNRDLRVALEFQKKVTDGVREKLRACEERCAALESEVEELMREGTRLEEKLGTERQAKEELEREAEKERERAREQKRLAMDWAKQVSRIGKELKESEYKVADLARHLATTSRTPPPSPPLSPVPSPPSSPSHHTHTHKPPLTAAAESLPPPYPVSFLTSHPPSAPPTFARSSFATAAEGQTAVEKNVPRYGEGRLCRMCGKNGEACKNDMRCRARRREAEERKRSKWAERWQ